MANRLFPTSAALQDYLLKEARPGALTLVPHQRLARQVWRRQRLRHLEQGLAAWEPLPLTTLGRWWADLRQSLWLPQAVASPLQRLACWRRALETGPPLEGVAPDLSWAQAMDEAYSLLTRHRLPFLESDPRDSPLVSWRRRLMGLFQEIMRDEGYLAPAELPVYLLKALETGKIALPARLLIVGLETPAPVEDLWLQAVARHIPVAHLQIKGNPEAVRRAVVLPDRRQEVEWAAARLLELAAEGIPLHRLALTSPDLASYLPELRRAWAELLGPPASPEGWAYNFSQGPVLGDTPLWQAALLPVKFANAGELREDLVSLLLSPYYGAFQAHQQQLPLWDRIFRERRVERSWQALSRVAAQTGGSREVITLLDHVWQLLASGPAPARDWAERLQKAWRLLGFPRSLEDTEAAPWNRTTSLLAELKGALGGTTLTALEFREWLNLGARQILLPGEGVQDAGLQIMGLLEMRGLDFDRVICLGMNSGVFPPPPRPLPLLSSLEKQKVLGGTYQSQHHFARELFVTFLAAAPEITLTRPRTADQEECVGTSMFPGKWEEDQLSPLTRPHRAWLRSPGVRAAFAAPESEAPPPAAEAPVSLTLPEEVSLTQAQVALGCACRFLLEVLLKIRDLPEIETGLSPAERGDLLHKVLARFAGEFKQLLEQHPEWDEDLKGQAAEMLAATARLLLKDRLSDLHWQAELDRWLGPEGLLWEWLSRERERYQRGWRWLALEERFQGLQGPGWPFRLKGRIDRIDIHPDEGLILWDYKTGKIPGVKKVFDAGEEFQLPGYLAAVQQGQVAAAQGQAPLKAGFIGLKSARQKDLQHEEFSKRSGEWQRVVAKWIESLTALGARLAAGNFSPEPFPAPQGKDKGACEYCPYLLLCGFSPPEALEDEEEGE
ncbi:MAG: PD-(D/E)XK nuclease family protein [Thermodesulfobacteriota bacterium]